MRRRVAVTALAVIIVLAGCATPERPGAARGSGADGNPAQAAGPTGRVLVGIRGAPASLSVAKTSSNVAGLDGLEMLVRAGMTQFDPQDALRPQLAEAVPTLDNGLWKLLPDGRMETTWRIKPAAQWHDGTPVTSGDLLFTTEVEQDVESGVIRDGIYDLIEGIEATDERTVVVRWKQPYIDADTLFSHAVGLPLPRHILEKHYREERTSAWSSPYWSTEFVGTGPFRIREWVADSHAMLQAFDGFILGRPKVAEVEVKFIPDPNTMMANVLAGAVEITLGRGLDFNQGQELERQWSQGSVRYHSTGWFKTSPQFVDPRPAVVTDLRFRQALMHATDRQEMTETFTGGLAPIADSLVLSHIPEFKAVESSIVRYDYDPRRASQMLESLGYARGSDNALRDAAGQRLWVEIRTTIGLPIQANVIYALADYWKQAGLDVDTIPISVQQMRDREYRATFPSFEMVSATTSLAVIDIVRWHSSKSPMPENRFTITGNDPRYKNAEFDALIERYITTIPKEERLRALTGLVRHQTEQLTSMGLFYTMNPSLIPHRLQNATIRSSRTNEAWNAHEWAIK
jgi:peptide/nickel transport system substrate-binding protein